MNKKLRDIQQIHRFDIVRHKHVIIIEKHSYSSLYLFL